MPKKKCPWCRKGKLNRGDAAVLMGAVTRALLEMAARQPRRTLKLHLAWLPGTGKDAKGEVYLECPCQRKEFPKVVVTHELTEVR